MINSTVQNVDGTLTSTFWTSMVNDADDFGDAAKTLAISILASENFQVIDSKIEMDY